MKILDWNVYCDITEEKYRVIEGFNADICILQECLPLTFEKYKTKWKHSFFYSDTIYEKDNAGYGIAIFSNNYEIRFTQNFNRNFRYVIPQEVRKDNAFLFYLFTVWTKSLPEKHYQNVIKALDFEGYKDYLSGPALFVGDFNTPTTKENDKAYQSIISKGLLNCVAPGSEFTKTYSHSKEENYFTADYCLATPEMRICFGIEVTIHKFTEDNTTKLKYKQLSDHVPLEIDITKLPV